MLSTGLQPRSDILMHEKERFFSLTNQRVRSCEPEADHRAYLCNHSLLVPHSGNRHWKSASKSEQWREFQERDQTMVDTKDMRNQ